MLEHGLYHNRSCRQSNISNHFLLLRMGLQDQRDLGDSDVLSYIYNTRYKRGLDWLPMISGICGYSSRQPTARANVQMVEGISMNKMLQLKPVFKMAVNPLSPGVKLQILPFVFPYISYRSSGEKLLKYQ